MFSFFWSAHFAYTIGRKHEQTIFGPNSFITSTTIFIISFLTHRMVLMTAVSVVLKIAYLVLESLKFKSSPFSFHIIYPVIVHGIKQIKISYDWISAANVNSLVSLKGLTLIALSFSSKLLRKEIMNHHENEEILKMCNGKPIYLPTRKKKKVWASATSTDRIRETELILMP